MRERINDNTFGTRLAEAGCDAFTIAQLPGHSDVRVTMRYVRAVETSQRVAVEAVRLNSEKLVTFWSVGQNSPGRWLEIVETNWWSRGGSNP
ncbi:MAG TPA: hypothetical protein VF074_09330 [Pyrinomonadaceae bacterium]